MSESPALFPKILSPVFEVVSAPCPLEEEERRTLDAWGFVLPPALGRAVPKRQEEFRAGRFCAAQALARAGADPRTEIGIGADHAPAWPAGFVGSIAHGHGRAAAAVARSAHAVSVGLDLEPVMTGERAARLRGQILTPADEELVSRLPGWGAGEGVTLVFSAKEAIYKCLRPVCGRYFSFRDAELEAVDERAGLFGFRLVREIGPGFGAGWTGQGRFARGAGWLYAAVELLRD